MLATTDPSDLILDITCGSGTTAFVAEQWGRRWITCDTSRVALALAKQRLMTATFDYFGLAKPDEGVSSGFKYKTVPHLTLKSIANNEPPATETLYDQPLIEKNTARVTSPFTVEAKLFEQRKFLAYRSTRRAAKKTRRRQLSSRSFGLRLLQRQRRHNRIQRQRTHRRLDARHEFRRTQFISASSFLPAFGRKRRLDAP